MNTIEKILNWLTVAVTIGSLVRVALYRAPDLLTIFIPRERPFWLGYAKLVEACDVILGWLTGALAKYGKSDLLQPEHLERLRSRTPPPPLIKPPIAALDTASEEPTAPLPGKV